MYGYISEKARLFLKLKSDKYRKNDALGMPDPDLSEEETKLLISGCMQIREDKGESPENPLTEIGIHGFYLLIELFHFKVGRQSIFHSSKEGYLDEMECVHLITGQKLTLYNSVKKQKEKSECN